MKVFDQIRDPEIAMTLCPHIYVCMCVCMCVCVYLYVYVYVCVRVCACVRAGARARARVCGVHKKQLISTNTKKFNMKSLELN